jgi:hypothetical protein
MDISGMGFYKRDVTGEGREAGHTGNIPDMPYLTQW